MFICNERQEVFSPKVKEPDVKCASVMYAVPTIGRRLMQGPSAIASGTGTQLALGTQATGASVRHCLALDSPLYLLYNCILQSKATGASDFQ